MQKHCAKCLETKDISEFHRDKSKLDGHTSSCKECAITNAKKHYQEHKETHHQTNRKWAENNKEKTSSYKDKWEKNNPNYKKQYYENNKEQLLLSKKQWRDSNKEKLKLLKKEEYQRNKDTYKKTRKKRYWDNREEAIKYSAQWAKDNPDKVKIYREKERQTEKYKIEARNRSALRRTLIKTKKIGLSDLAILKVQQDNKCFYCGGTLTKFHFDHIIPIAKGGEHKLNNIVLACPKCNQSKNDMNPEEFVNKILERKAV